MKPLSLLKSCLGLIFLKGAQTVLIVHIFEWLLQTYPLFGHFYIKFWKQALDICFTMRVFQHADFSPAVNELWD